MKTIVRFVITASILLFTACNEKIEEKEKDTLSITPAQLEFTAEDTRKQIVSVTTNASNWDATRSDDWLIISKATDRFVVAVEANEVTSERTGTITVTAGDAEPVIIPVKQLAGVDKTPVLQVSSVELAFASVGIEQQTITVTTNAGDWKVAKSANWIMLEREDDELLVTVERNWLTNERSGTITVTAGELEPVIITVTQLAYAPDWASDPHMQELRAFPGAEGFGAFVSGGRGGTVVYVTNLNDDGVGSLRWAITRSDISGPRIVLFKVSGTIRLQSRLNITRSNITIAGHTAPGDGICIADHFVYVGASNVVIRYMRFRMGDLFDIENDVIWGRYQSNIILDHCSMSWSTDECASFYDNENFTMQWCILSESLRWSVHEKGAHGYGGIWGGKQASFHHNLLAHHDSRNPRFTAYTYNNANRKDAGLVDFRNNVIYNWGMNSGYGGEGGRYNMVNNYYQPSPTSSRNTQIFAPGADEETGVYGTFYVAGNVMMHPGGSVNREVSNDNWLGVPQNLGIDVRSYTEFDKGTIHTHTAQEAYELVLAHVGASYKRDAIDTRIVDEVRNRETPERASGNAGTRPGLIDSQADVGGWCELESLSAPPDTDGDGMPDEWEIANGLNPNDPSDGVLTSLSGGTYTNLEVYLYDLLRK